MTIKEFLLTTTKQFQATGNQSARLDAQLLLMDELQQSKAWLLTHDDETLNDTRLTRLQQKIERRLQREPMAYIRGHQEFYGRNFIVTPDVLIPRPETEAIISELIAMEPVAGASLSDIGTGSGAIAITAKLELPQLEVHASDISPSALAVAKQNATIHSAEIIFQQQNLLKDVSAQNYDIIVANLPYVDRSWKRSPETNFEPAIALFANDNGLTLIKELITQAKDVLRPHGYLLLEADPKQHQAIIVAARTSGFSLKSHDGYIIVLAH